MRMLPTKLGSYTVDDDELLEYVEQEMARSYLQ